MLDPSSSEEESDEIVEEESGKEVLGSAASGARLSPSRTSEGSGGGAGLGGGGGAGAGAGVGAGGGGSGASSGGGAGGLQPSSRAAGGRPSSPSPSVVSEKEKEELERLQKEEEERKKRLQLYVFVMRCIAYPFNAKQPTDMARRQQKVGAPGRPSGSAGKSPGGRGEQWELAAQLAGRSRGWRPRPGEGAARPPFRGRDPGGAWSAAPRSGPPRERGMRASQVLLGGPGGSGSDWQPAAPTEAWLARGLPALSGGGRRLSAPGPPSWACARPAGAPAGRGARVEPAERLCAALGSRKRRATAGPGGRKQARKAKLPVSPGRAPSSLPRVSRSRLGLSKGPGAPLSWVPSDPPSSSSLTPKQGTPCGPSARVRPSTFLPMTLFSSQGDFAATFWLSEALNAWPPLAP